MRVFGIVWIAVSVVVGLAGSAQAQAVGQILGVVTDATGAVLPKVTVTVSGTGLQQPVARSTMQDGAYTVPDVPIGTYVVSFELNGFKKAVRPDVVITTGFSATVNMKLELGPIGEQVEVAGAPSLVDTKRTTTGATITLDVMTNVPTARDPFQVMNLAPSVVLNGTADNNTFNVGGSAAGTVLTPMAFSQAGSPMWNLEGGSITDMAALGPPTFFNFDSFQEIQVITGGADVTVQASGVFINLVTKSGSNVVKGTGVVTFENSSMQAQNVTEAMFNGNTSGNAIGLSGNPIHRIDSVEGDVGGPIIRNRLWYWGAASNQDVNLSIGSFFNTALPGCNPPPSTFAQLTAVQACLENSRTILRNFNVKFNGQLTRTQRVQLLVQTAQNLNNNVNASATITPVATASAHGIGGVGPFQDPTYQLMHTWLPSDRLVVVSQLTYLRGGFINDFHDYPRCGSSTYARDAAGNDPTDPTCQWNIQEFQNATTGLWDRSSEAGSFQTQRDSWEAKSEATYFRPHLFGGDHALKFGVGWRRAPTLTFTHQGRDAAAIVQCENNANCGDMTTFVAPGTPGGGLVPSQALLFRDTYSNFDWHTYFGYVQDAFTRSRLTVTAGTRYDWQTSMLHSGCVQANVVEPALLPAQCQGTVDPHHPFHNFAPRASVTYDLTGRGTTAVHASFGMYYETETSLAEALNDLVGVTLAYNQNQANGACSPVPGASCWTDANHDGVIRASELIGLPSGPGLFVNGVYTASASAVDPNEVLGRTREGIGGLDHQLLPNVHVMFDFVYRYYDDAPAAYLATPTDTGPEAVAQNVAAVAQWQPHAFTDPNTGVMATYYTLCPGCPRLTGTRLLTNSRQYSVYKGTVLTLTKRLANRWQGTLSYNWNDPRVFTPVGSFSTNGATPGNPTGVQFQNGFTNGTLGWTVKAYGSAELPHGFTVGVNWNIEDGVVRSEVINGPGTVPSGTRPISYRTLAFEDLGSSRLPATSILDVNIAKTFPVGRQRLTFTLNCFNVFNANTVLSYTSDNASNNGVNGSIPSFNSMASIVPPRVFRIDARFSF